jgi:hypothetical protein
MTETFGRSRVIDRFEAVFRRCGFCGCVYAENPHWLSSAYEDAIARQDIGLVSRNVYLARRTQRVLATHFRKATTFLDFGAGTGMFVRLMRDAGYDFKYFDEYGPNLYAQGHETTDVSGFDVVTTFEVLEHLIDPVSTLRAVASGVQALLATTEVLPSPPPRIDEWWYYALGTGQHITFYTHDSLDALAARLGLVRTSSGSYHVFARQSVSQPLLRLLTAERVFSIPYLLARRSSLLPNDYYALTGETLHDSEQHKRGWADGV